MDRKCVALLTQSTSNSAEYKSSLPNRVPGTCQWILSNPQYLEWNLQKESCLLWISGYPGSGKTILSAYILEYLAAGELSPSLRTALCFFFCDEKIDTQRDGKAILRSLIHQLLVRRQSLIKYVKSVYDVQGPQFNQNFDQLWRTFVAIASDKRVGPISVIVDAIDECEQETRERFLQGIKKLMSNSRSAGSNPPCIKFLVTSRPRLGRQYTKNILQIDPSQNHVEKDLRLVIQTKVEGIVERTQCKPDVRAYLENALYSKAGRTFLWVALVFHLLEQSFLASQKDFRRIIDDVPKTLEATYGSFLHGISKEYQLLATRLLHFLVGSSRTLTLKEMQTLLAMEDHHRTLAAIEEDAQPNIQETIEGVLGPLVRIWDSGIYLLHTSLKEYLQDLSTRTEDPLSAIYGVDPCKANLLLAKACVSYLLLDDFKQDLLQQDQSNAEDSPISPAALSTIESIEQPWGLFDVGETTLFQEIRVFESDTYESIRNQYAFFDYSVGYWAEHFSSACSISPPELQKSILSLSDIRSSQGLNWFRYYWSYYANENSLFPRDFVPTITASYFGHLTSLKTLLREGLPLESDIGARALYWASRNGHHDVVDLLLKENVNPDVEVGGQTALITAIEFNRVTVVTRLLQDDGFISEKEGYRVHKPNRWNWMPLHIATRSGLVEIVRQLLQHPRIQPDLADFNQWTPLFWSVHHEYLDLVQLLLADNRVSVNHLDMTGQNVLSVAAPTGNLELVKRLMSVKNLKANQPDRSGVTALFWAARFGRLEVTQYLLRSRHFDVSKKDEDGRNVLWWACMGYQPTVVQYLIKHDPQGVDLEDVAGWTPLVWVSARGATKVLQVLLDSGLVDVNKKNRDGRTALSLAADRGHLDVVEMLLNTEGIEIDSKDNHGRSVLSYAKRYPDIVVALEGFRK